MRNMFGLGSHSATSGAKENTAPSTRKDEVFVSSEAEASVGNTAVVSKQVESTNTAAPNRLPLDHLSPSTARTTATESAAEPTAEQSSPGAVVPEDQKASTSTPQEQSKTEDKTEGKTEVTPLSQDSQTPLADTASAQPPATDKPSKVSPDGGPLEKDSNEKSVGNGAAVVSSTNTSEGGGKKVKASAAVQSAKKVAKEDKKRKGAVSTNSSPYAVQRVISNVLKMRTKEDIDSENKKLRSDLTSMRRSLNAVQERVASLVSTLKKIRMMQGMPHDAIEACRLAEGQAVAHIAAYDFRLQPTEGITLPGDPRQHGRQRRWAQREPLQEHEMHNMNPYDMALYYNPAMHQAHTTGPGGKKFGAQGGYAPVGEIGMQQKPQQSAAAARGSRNRLRRGQMAAAAGGQIDPRDTAPRRTANDTKTAAQASLAQNIRNELRMSENPEDLAKAIEKASKCGMNYEADLGKKKLAKLQPNVDGTQKSTAVHSEESQGNEAVPTAAGDAGASC